MDDRDTSPPPTPPLSVGASVFPLCHSATLSTPTPNTRTETLRSPLLSRNMKYY